MINKSTVFDLSEAKNFYKDAFSLLGRSDISYQIKIRYYPYVNVNHTIRIRDGIVLVRISDLFKFANQSAHKSLALILVAKLLNKKVPSEARRIYREFVASADFREIAFENKRTKGRKVITSAKGETYDLDGIFEKLNLIYFKSTMSKPTLTWSPRKTFRRLGHFDPAHNSITISKSLDESYVPKFVVEYVLYHEMLHIKHPTEHRNGRRYNHTPSFKSDEKNFLYFEEAEDWISKNAELLKRRASQ